jgi:hypothetical protein
MRSLMVLIGLMASTVSWAGERTVIVCLTQTPEVEFRIQALAQGYASRIYHSVGIGLRWKAFCTEAERDAPGTAFDPNLATLGLEWAPEAPAKISRTALASARPFRPTGTRITLYLDRLQPVLEDHFLAPVILGHVFAHEIGHILLGSDGHAEEGLMKATWSPAEQYAIRCRPMLFTSDEGERMRQRLGRRPPVLTATR